LPLGLGQLPPHVALRRQRLVQGPPRLSLGLAHDHLGFAGGGRSRVFAQLLRRDQRLIHRALPLAECAQLLGERDHALFEHGPLAQDALQLVGDARPELFDADRLEAAQRFPELLLPDVERCQVKAVFAHAALGPNSTVPRRSIVAPSSTATP
jgi:hypothetical protein